MPFTPFHFGPGGVVALPLNRYIDVPAFLLASVAVDLEPLAVMAFSLSYPLHGYAHSFAGASVVCVILGLVLFRCQNIISPLMQKCFRKSYASARNKVIISAVLGGWFHVLLDSMLYYDIKPFFPSRYNPFRGVIEADQMYLWCALAFIPAALIYGLIWFRDRR